MNESDFVLKQCWSASPRTHLVGCECSEADNPDQAATHERETVRQPTGMFLEDALEVTRYIVEPRSGYALKGSQRKGGQGHHKLKQTHTATKVRGLAQARHLRAGWRAGGRGFTAHPPSFRPVFPFSSCVTRCVYCVLRPGLDSAPPLCCTPATCRCAPRRRRRPTACQGRPTTRAGRTTCSRRRP